MQLPRTIFKKYDIRGRVGAEINAEAVAQIGRAYGTYVQDEGRRKVYVGYDNRPASRELAASLAAGLLETGCAVVDVGMVPTPLLYFAATRDGDAFGAMVTASHLPATSNGVKFCRGRWPVYGETIAHLRDLAEAGTFRRGMGERRTAPDTVGTYIAYVARQLSLPRPLTVAVECLNGAASVCAPRLLEQLGVRVIPVHCDPHAPYPCERPDPSIPANTRALQEAVKAHGADVGLAYDGDADRLGVVDETGNYVFADRVLALLARDILRHHPGGKVVFDILSTQALADAVEQSGGVPVFWKSGHAFIKEKLHTEGAVLAGESSGHIFFADRYFGYDDAIYASCRLVALLARQRDPLSALVVSLPQTYLSPEERPPCPDEAKAPIVAEITEAFRAEGYPVVTVDGVRITFPQGWGLVRASNTEAVLSLRFEAATPEALEAYRAEVWARLREIGARHGVVFTPTL